MAGLDAASVVSDRMIIPETIRRTLPLPGQHPPQDDGSRVGAAGRPFAEHFVLGFEPEAEVHG